MIILKGPPALILPCLLFLMRILCALSQNSKVGKQSGPKKKVVKAEKSKKFCDTA